VEAAGIILAVTTIIAKLSEQFTESDGFVYLNVRIEDIF
jgi:hypothetical protein